MLERIEPSVNALITHISEQTGYEAPDLPEPPDAVVEVEHEESGDDAGHGEEQP